MKLLVLVLAVLFMVLLPLPANSQYDNGRINGTVDAWTINFGYVVSDSFQAYDVSAFQIGVWLFPGDTVTALDWSITSSEFGGTVYGSGTASGRNVTDTFVSSNQYGYNIDVISVSGMNVPLTGSTYWLNLANASVSSGDPVYWDENSGAGCQGNGCPSSASESAIGTIPSEAFTIGGACCGTTPEPSGFSLFATGILGVAGVLRRKFSL